MTGTLKQSHRSKTHQSSWKLPFDSRRLAHWLHRCAWPLTVPHIHENSMQCSTGGKIAPVLRQERK
jgi:hypothetical protein